MKTLTWQDYFETLVDCGRKHVWQFSAYPKDSVMSFIELHEMAGYLLKRDLTTKLQDIATIMAEICERGGYSIADLMAAYCCENSVENAEDLLTEVKKSVANYYEDEIQEMLNKYWQDVETSQYEEAGFVPVQSLQNGEWHWRRR